MADARVHILRAKIRIMQEELDQLSSEYYKKVPKSVMNEIHSLMPHRRHKPIFQSVNVNFLCSHFLCVATCCVPCQTDHVTFLIYYHPNTPSVVAG